MPFYSVVIPVYKSTQSLEEIARQFDNLQQKEQLTIELIFVNDSPEFLDTGKTLDRIRQQYKNIKVITLRKNQGQHLALLVGLKMAKGDYVITMDDDLQHPVSEITKLIKATQEFPDAEAVFAAPAYSKKKHNFWRNTGSYILNKVDILFLKKPRHLIKSPFRIITGDIAKSITANYNAMPAVSSLLINATNNIINIEVEHGGRVYGKSNYGIRKLISLTFNNIIHYSSLPLKVVGAIGFLGFLFSLFFVMYTLFKKFYWGIDFPGYASTVSLISFFGGLNLLALGVMGEYLLRIIKEQQKPQLEDLIKKQT